MTTFYKGDCLQWIKRLEDKSVNMVYWNPPFGTTYQPWDEELPWAELFKECFRVLKNDGMIVIHCSVPFNYTLIKAAPRPPSYTWYWDKTRPTTPLLAKTQPLRQVEEVLVWKKKKNTYYPQRVGNELRTFTSDAKTRYVRLEGLSEQKEQTVKGYYQRHLITMNAVVDGFSTRPRELIELMIRSYTKEGDTVLDPTCYRGITGKICKEMKRKWIGIDKYFFADYIL
jgi:site-specific DNA-methyltransferase (adenine-specific)